MTGWSPTPEQINTLIEALYQAQDGLRRLLFALGLGAALDGQPAWPWALRLQGEPLRFEPALARQLLGALATLAALPLLGLLAWRWRRGRWPVGVAALALGLAAPWSVFAVLAGPATPSSFHTSPTGFSAQAIVQGQRLYQRHCQRCHGADGGGEGPDAASLPMWPPNLNSRLLWQRLEGELWWRIRHGLGDRQGRATMPGFAAELDAGQTWQLIDFLQAQAAGQSLAREGRWALPVRLPDATLRCAGQAAPRRLRALQGQRLLVASAPGPRLPSDPRLLSIGWADAGAGADTAPDGAGADCLLPGPEQADFAQALAVLQGQPRPAEGGAGSAAALLLVDREGWLRARSPAGQAWSAADLLCRSGEAQSGPGAGAGPAGADAGAAGGDALGALIAAIDADPLGPRRRLAPH